MSACPACGETRYYNDGVCLSCGLGRLPDDSQILGRLEDWLRRENGGGDRLDRKSYFYQMVLARIAHLRGTRITIEDVEARGRK